MSNMELIDVFDCDKRCEYKGRNYIVRNNGAILRLPKEGGKASRCDNVWTFGNKDSRTGYMLFAGEIRVHQVVCTAFHGQKPDKNLVVDHKDTNRCNNRPENLHWVTRLENALNNPFTRKKIIQICGSVEAFLKDPSILSKVTLPPNIEWMRTVTKEEAAKCIEKLTRWEGQDKDIKPSGKGFNENLFIDEFKPSYKKQIEEIEKINQVYFEKMYGLKDSLTPGAKQLNWKTPTTFPSVPQIATSTPVKDYLSNLPKGAIFCQNSHGNSIVYDADISEDGSHLAVITLFPSGVSKYALTEVTFDNGAFIHKSIRSFFTENGATKYFTISLGKEWTGGDVMEDFC